MAPIEILLSALFVVFGVLWYLIYARSNTRRKGPSHSIERRENRVLLDRIKADFGPLFEYRRSVRFE
ncbi:hypothetical protein SAMN05444422_11221 [Halobiforma haloterrestris]|uniref:Uncharacterized protein n=1 Tax=Natronobacterium haloterrestre TaxID=148448 RepID=A0A1I1KRX6_NATHA|nr:hypothetical protein SAMN05444422_11221 [Halobiforma haloterrestris]